MARLDRDAHDTATAGFDDVATNNRVRGPVGTLDEHIRTEAGDRLMRCFFVEDHDGIHAVERIENLGAFALGSDRPAAALDRTDGAIGIQPDNQYIAEGAGLPQVPEVTRMEQIEDPVREHHLAILLTATLREGGRRGSA